MFTLAREALEITNVVYSACMPGTEEQTAVWRLLFMSMINLLNTVEADVKAADDLTLIDMGCLFALNAARDSGLPMSSLAELMSVDPSVITYRVKRLEGRGLAEREVNQDNRRFVRARLTPAGRKLLRRARSHMLASADKNLFAHLEPGEVESLHQMLLSLRAAQDAQRLAASDVRSPC